MILKIESNLPKDLEDLIRKVIGAAIEVHRHLGPGYVESIYAKALCYEFSLRGITYECQKEIKVIYKSISIPGQRLDLLVEDKLIIELKVADEIVPIYEAQLISYLKTTGLRAGLIINFKVKQLIKGLRRIVL